uniref:Putative reeler domain protein n=1 Tax=Ixodes ricinus TaxID=34613 RepID=A0A6B0UZE0_IXORI
MSRVVTALVLLMIVDVSILALPTGAPEAACKGMVPGHRGAAMFKGARSGTYTLSQPKNHFRKGEIMNVTLVTNSNAFRGFMVKALIRGGLDDNGQFLESEKVKPISICSAATQKTSDKKFAVILHWKAPDNTTGEVRFHATVVEVFSRVFLGLHSEVIDDDDYYESHYKHFKKDAIF